MGLLELVLLAVGLSMDAFAVAICKGLALKKVNSGQMALVGLWFGGFQALMPVLGYFVGVLFRNVITAIDHWIAFGLLALIGGNMILAALRGETEEAVADLSVKRLFLLALATSIDALAVGISLAFTNVNILLSAVIIGAVAFILAMLGGLLGRRLGELFQRRATLAGGVVLVCIGVKILFEHLTGAA